jgi:hypothetical protein
VPVSLFAPGSPLQEMLVAYKSAPSPSARHERQSWLAGLLGEFLSLHLSCLAEPGPVASPGVLAIPVPSSSSPRASWGGQHPLVGLVAAAVASEPRLELAARLVRGHEPLGHLRADPGGFRVVGPVSGRRALVIDDTYTSGARSQSAAAALAAEGADVLGIVPIGRLIRPGHNGSTAALWRRQQRARFDPRRCAGPCHLLQSPAGQPGPVRAAS